jgi:hypothetical protein
MKRNSVIVIMALMIAIMLLPGCTSVVVEKPDGVKVTVITVGSSQVSDMAYQRRADGIVLTIGQTSNTPAGIPETIEATGKAITAITTAGVSSAVETVIQPTTATDPDD